MCPGAGCWIRKSAALMGKSRATSFPSTRWTKLGTLASSTTRQSTITIPRFTARGASRARAGPRGGREKEKKKLTTLDGAPRRQPADDQEHHRLERPDL